jgi:hypothetical protein
MEKNIGAESFVEDMSKAELELSSTSYIPDLDIEKKICQRSNIRILPLSILLYLCAFIDRSNMGNARILGLQKDLSLGGYKFNEALTAFFVAYIAFEMNFVPPFPNLKDTTD